MLPHLPILLVRRLNLRGRDGRAHPPGCDGEVRRETPPAMSERESDSKGLSAVNHHPGSLLQLGATTLS